jgi:hypothetical protein
MAPLRNVRHEAFARELIEAQRHGRTQAEAYQRAGYRAGYDGAEASAARLIGNVRAGVAQRVQELMQNGAKRAEVTVASLLGELEAARAGASDDRQFGAATAAIIAKARLLGLDRENGNGSGSPFDACQSVAEVVAKWLTEFETPAAALAELDAWRAQVESFAANHAVVISPAEPARPRPDVARLSLQYLQPRRRRR